MRRLAAAVAGAAFASVAACTAAPAPADRGSAPAAPPAPAARADTPAPGPAADIADTSRIARLEREARALAHADRCTAGQCRTAPVGSRPCGGPRTYLVYCAETTDSAALFATLAELARAEEAYNRRNQLASTCEFRMPPGVSLSGGRCTAAPANEAPPQ